MPEVKTVTFRLPEPMYEWLRAESYETRRSMNELALEAFSLPDPDCVFARPREWMNQ